MQRKIVRADELLRQFDFYHLAKEVYKHIYRHPKLEEDAEWKNLKKSTEDFLVEQRFRRATESETTPEDYRDFLRFYTGLEIKNEEIAPEFIFGESEKNIFRKIIKKR